MDTDKEDTSWKVGNLTFDKVDELTKPARDISNHIIARETLQQIFLGSVAKEQVFDVDGSGPFDEDKLADLIDLLGVFNPYLIDDITDLDEGLSEFGFVYYIVGRNDYDTESLDWVLEQLIQAPGTIRVISQEDFLNYWLFNQFEPYTRDDPRVYDHPALAYLAEHSGPRWPWPSTEPEPSLGHEVDNMGWREQHPLKARFGYTVDSFVGLSDRERQRCLDQALTASVDPIPLQEIVELIAWQVRWKKKSPKYHKAVAKWESDLAYLKEKYYKRQFTWPETG